MFWTSRNVARTDLDCLLGKRRSRRVGYGLSGLTDAPVPWRRIPATLWRQEATK
jgi:hypothetical protein